MRILFVVSEAYPLIKTGGLADVAGALPAALAECGEDIRILLPAYPEALERASERQRPISVGDPLGTGETWLVPARMPDSGVPIWLVKNAVFDRPGGPYVDDHGVAWRDNHLRFGLFCRVAALVTIAGGFLGWRPDVVHCNDWQAGMLPAYLRRWSGPITPSLFTIHNLQYQGNFDPWVLTSLALSPNLYNVAGVEFYGRVSFMKAGIQFSRKVTAVSPTYAREIQTPELGMGFHGLLGARATDLHGILNGVDYRVWDPAADRLIAAPYSPERLAGKAKCKAALQQELGLAQNPAAPLVGMVTRMNGEKGLDLLIDALPRIMDQGVQLAVLGSGDAYYEHVFTAAAASKSGRMAARIGFDEGLAHRLQAGCDMLLMPSRFEPCGLTQLYALKYGTVPVVRHTGGLADTVIDAGDPDRGTGIVFGPADPEALIEAVRRGVTLFENKTEWRKVQRRGMSEDFSWIRSARSYSALYRDIV